MGIISVSLPSDGTTADVADVNTPLTTIATEINGNLDNNNIKSGAAIDGSKLADASIPATKLATGAITLGYAQRTSDFTTTSLAAVTNLSVTVTIPSGGRRIKVTVWSADLSSSASATIARMTLWDGAVSSGTQLSMAQVTSAGANYGAPGSIVWTGTPSAGSKTYNVGLQDIGAATAKIQGGATYPAFILVEAI